LGFDRTQEKAQKDKMSRRKIKRALIGAGGVVLLFLCFRIHRVLFGSSGVDENVQELASACENAGPTYARCFTNTFFQNMPFVEPIVWKAPGVRPFVTVTSRVDVIAFKQKMDLEPFNYLQLESREGKPAATFLIYHRAGEWVVMTLGTLNLSSGAFSMTSHQLERMQDDAQWLRLNKGGDVDFDFKAAN
jgi:hypothetical protein